MDLIRFARRYMRPHLGSYALGTVALFATNWLSVTIPLYLAEGIDALASGDGALDVVARTAWIVAAMGVAVILVRTASRVLYFTPGRHVEADVKRDLFAAIIAHQPAFLRQWAPGDLFSRVSSDVNMLRLIAGFGVLQAVNTTLAVILAGTQMARISPQLAGYIALPILAGLVITQLFVRRIFVLIRRQQIELAALSDHTLASYQGVATIQGFVAEPAFHSRFDKLNRDYLRTSVERSILRSVLGPTLGLAAAVNIFLLLYLGGPQAIAGDLTVGELIAFITLAGYVVMPLRATSFLATLIKQAQAALERTDAILLAPPERPEWPGGAIAADAPPALDIRGLTFAYPDADEPALDDVSFALPAGATLGITGPTGSGKTTLLRCITRLYNPPAGQVWVDDKDVLELDLDTWRERLTLVTQRPFLFSESLADNILLGTADPASLGPILDRAALRVDVDALPDGSDTLVGESGVRLSGGQRQRTALARGLARDHRLLILDDVLSAVDHATERQLIASIRSTEQGAQPPTTILVAHRLSALQHADLVLVLEDGRVTALDTPDNLRRTDGYYRTTWLQQQEGAE